MEKNKKQREKTPIEQEIPEMQLDKYSLKKPPVMDIPDAAKKEMEKTKEKLENLQKIHS